MPGLPRAEVERMADTWSPGTSPEFQDLRETPAWRRPGVLLAVVVWAAVLVPIVVVGLLLGLMWLQRAVPPLAFGMPAALVLAFGGLARLLSGLMPGSGVPSEASRKDSSNKPRT